MNNRSLTGSPLTDDLVPIAVALIGAVRDGNPDTVTETFERAARLVEHRCDPARALAVVLAAMVDEDTSPARALSWWGYVAEYERLRATGVSESAADQLAAARVKGAA
ncbi:MAG: hypothetical protein ACRDQG_12135 [Pseudonocardiaceae bacterium]